MSLQLPLQPTVNDSTALVQLKGLADEAKESTRHYGLRRRLVSIVLLDAVNESALNLVATGLGVELRNTENFDGLKSKVDQVFARANLTPTRNKWREVRKLHLARNLAQHHGIQPDERQIVGWSTATFAFVDSIVSATYGLRLKEVSFADSIVSTELREGMRLAEQQLNSGKYREATEATFTAFRKAKKLWERQSRIEARNIRSRPHRADIVDPAAFHYLEAKSDFGIEIATHQGFGSNGSEYSWFRHLMNDGADKVTREEAERALSYAFWWILDWEGAAERFVDNRHRREQVAARLRRSGRGPFTVQNVHLDAGLPIFGEDGRSYEARLECSGWPTDEAEFEIWSTTVASSVKHIEGVRSARVDEAGRLIFYFDSTTRVREMVDQVQLELAKVEDQARSKVAQVQAAQAADDHRRSEYAAQVKALRGRIPSWISDIRLAAPGEFMDENSVRVIVNDVSVSNQLTEAFDAATDISFSAQSFPEIIIKPEVSPERILAVAATVAERIEEQAESARARDAANQAEATKLMQEFGRLRDSFSPREREY